MKQVNQCRSKRQITGKRSAALLTILATSAFANAATIDWDLGQWSHTSQATPDTGYNDGATDGSSNLGGGITVNVTHSFTGGVIAETGNLTVSGNLNGADTDPSIRLQQSADNSPTATTMTKYSTLTLTFNKLVTSTAFTFYDVDKSPTTSWWDFMSVKAFNGVTPVSVTYSPTVGNQTITQYGLAGVGGISDVANDSADGNVGVSVAGEIDRLEIVFTQHWNTAVGSAPSSSHGVGISDISVVPESTSALLCGLGLLTLLRRRR